MEMLPTLNNQWHALNKIKMPFLHLIIKKHKGVSHDSWFIHIFYWSLPNSAWTKALKCFLFCRNESKDCLFWDFGLIYTLLLLAYSWKLFMISGSQVYQYPVVIPYKMNWIWTWIQFFFSFQPSFFFLNSMTTIQHKKKSTITININFKQLKSTKCFKYIKCSISNSLEKMLARLDREAVCNNRYYCVQN